VSLGVARVYVRGSGSDILWVFRQKKKRCCIRSVPAIEERKKISEI